jgi:hypothetical protein
VRAGWLRLLHVAAASTRVEARKGRRPLVSLVALRVQDLATMHGDLCCSPCGCIRQV